MDCDAGVDDDDDDDIVDDDNDDGVTAIITMLMMMMTIGAGLRQLLNFHTAPFLLLTNNESHHSFPC